MNTGYRMVKCTKEEIEVVNRRVYGKNYQLLNDFRESDMDCCKLEGWTQKDAKNCKNSLDATINRYKMFTIGVMTRDNTHVYLYKKDAKK